MHKLVNVCVRQRQHAEDGLCTHVSSRKRCFQYSSARTFPEQENGRDIQQSRKDVIDHKLNFPFPSLAISTMSPCLITVHKCTVLGVEQSKLPGTPFSLSKYSPAEALPAIQHQSPRLGNECMTTYTAVCYYCTPRSALHDLTNRCLLQQLKLSCPGNALKGILTQVSLCSAWAGGPHRLKKPWKKCHL